MNKKKYFQLFIALLFTISFSFGQPAPSLVQINVQPIGEKWVGKLDSDIRFSIQVICKGVPLTEGTLIVEVGPERMSSFRIDTVSLHGESFITMPQRLKQPGFLRCSATVVYQGKSYKGLHTVAVEPEKILPTVQDPTDFDLFWGRTLKELSSVPLDAKLTLLPDRSSSTVNVYHVNIQNIGNSRLYGILCIPKKPGKYPAVLQVPGAGIRPYNPDLELAEKGLIVLTIGIHGISVIQDPSVYRDLEQGALKGYFFFNMQNRDNYYYRRVYAGCVRANDFLFSLPEFNGTHLAVSGNSQGGALSIVTAALDRRVKYLAAIHPALCDLTGYNAGRAGGWPHMFAPSNNWYTEAKASQQSLSYYDVVNFAKRVRIPGFYTWGFNDEVCPPTSMYAAYNTISATKSLVLFPETGHWFYPEQKGAMNNWLIEKLSFDK